MPVSYTYTIDPIRYAYAPEYARKWLFPETLNSGRYSRQLAPSVPAAAAAEVNVSTTTAMPTTTLMPSSTTSTRQMITTTEKPLSSNEPLDTLRGCYHQGRFVHERSLIQPKDSCMNCTCASGVVQCQLTLCTLYRNIPDGCQLVRHESQCCPALECGKSNDDDVLTLSMLINMSQFCLQQNQIQLFRIFASYETFFPVVRVDKC